MPDRVRRGVSSELSAASYFVERGCVVSMPVSGRGRYDLIVDDGDGLRRVQVKTAYATALPAEHIAAYGDADRLRYTVHCIVSGDIAGRGIETRYNSGDFDLLAAVELDSRALYVIPIGLLPPRPIYLYPKGHYRSPQSPEPRWERYRVR